MQKIKRLFALPEIALDGLATRDTVLAVVVVLLYYAFSTGMLFILEPGTQGYINGFIVAGFLFILVIVFLVTLLGQKRPLASLGIRFNPLPLAMIGLILAVAAYIQIAQEVPHYILRVVFHVVAVAGCEEVVFRGYLYPRLFSSFGFWPALLVSGVLFSWGHNIIDVVYNGAHPLKLIDNPLGYVLPNAGFVLLYAYTGNLLNAVVLHAAMNLSGEYPLFGLLGYAYTAVAVVVAYQKRKRVRVS